jgi:hypothetical protein
MSSSTTNFVNDTSVLNLVGDNGNTMQESTPTIYPEKFQDGTPYGKSGVVRTKGSNAEFVMNPYVILEPWSSDLNGKNWDNKTNKPVLSWPSFTRDNSIGWETVLVPSSQFPKEWDSSLCKEDDKGNFVLTLPYYKDANGNKVDLGISGRGDLGRFGSNGAADPVVSRWSYVTATDGSIQIETDEDGNPILELVLITRKDTGQHAIPGGMNVDPNGKIVDISMTLANEFLEETCSHAESDADKTELQLKQRDTLYKIVEKYGIDVFRGRNGDPRNTTHAWMVTVCKSIHDPTPDGFFQTFELRAGSDASAVSVVKWSPVLAKKHDLYANHGDMVNTCYKVQRFLLENQ